MLLNSDDELDLDPEIQEYIDFMDSDEQDNTGFLTKALIDEHREGWERIWNY